MGRIVYTYPAGERRLGYIGGPIPTGPNERVRGVLRSYCPGAAAAVWILVGATAGHAGVTGNVAFTSDYVSRGISYSDNDPAVQGGFDWSHPVGVYAGIWGSSVEFGTPAHVEMDVYIGVTRPTSIGAAWSVGLAYYTYPGASNLNYGEIYAGIAFPRLSAKLWYANDYAGTHGKEFYAEADLKLALPLAVELVLHGGYSQFEPVIGLRDYVDYGASLSRDYQGLNIGVSYSDTDQHQLGRLDDWKIVMTVSKHF